MFVTEDSSPGTAQSQSTGHWLGSIYGLQRSGLPTQSWQWDLGSNNQDISEETKANLSPPPTHQHFCGNLGLLFTWHR